MTQESGDTMARILIIDDDKTSLMMMQYILKAAGHEVFPLMNAAKAMDEIAASGAQLVITDIMMPGVTGGVVYEGIRATFGKELPVVISSATRLHMKGAKEDPLLAYCPKPIERDVVVETVRLLLEKAAALEGKPTPPPPAN